jgi:predicted ATPase
MQLRQMKASAGESTIVQLVEMAKFKNGLLILDEPCRGLSIKNQIQVARIIEKKFLVDHCQIICSTHSDIILKEFRHYAQYFEVKLGKDVSYKEYVTEQGLEVD